MDTVTIKVGDAEATLELIERGEDNPFSSGNTGYGSYGAVIMNGKSYQVTLNIVEKKPKKK